MLAAQAYDLVILDLGLPGLDGFEVLRRLRRRGAAVPVLVLTARDALPDRVKGLDLGADDYMIKPFDLPELEARVRALIRRGQSGGASVLTHGALVLDTAGRRATLGGEPLDLSARELGVLEVLMMRSGRVVNKEQLAEQLYGWDEEVGAERDRSLRAPPAPQARACGREHPHDTRASVTCSRKNRMPEAARAQPRASRKRCAGRCSGGSSGRCSRCGR